MPCPTDERGQVPPLADDGGDDGASDAKAPFDGLGYVLTERGLTWVDLLEGTDQVPHAIETTRLPMVRLTQPSACMLGH
jgi:hypothetical protein